MATRRKWLKRILIGLAGFISLPLAGIAFVVAWEWTYIDRLRRHPERLILDVDWYEPQETIPGGNGEPLPRATPEETTIRPEALEEAASIAESKNSSAVMIVHNGKVVLEKHWHGHKPGDRTNSASMAKTITSLLIGTAIEQGKIKSIDESASTWIPAWRNDELRDITLRHLLTMHSGIEPEGQYEDPFSNACYIVFGTDLPYLVDSAVRVHPPGEVYDYNNICFQSLGAVIEAATGKRYAEYLSECLWKPLGNSDGAVWLDKPGGCARTYGFIFAGIEDWARIGLMLMNDGVWNGRQIVSKWYLDEMLKPSPKAGYYGFGIWKAADDLPVDEEDTPFLDKDLFWLDGHSKQRVYVSRARKLVIVRVGENGKDWDEAALTNAAIRGLSP